MNQQKLDKVTEAAAEVKLTKYDKSKVAAKKAAKKEEKKAEVAYDNDVEMTDDVPKPKAKKAKGPPASFFKRQEEMESKAQEKFEELKAELGGGAPPPKVPKQEPKKAPPPAKASSSTVAAPKAAKPAGKKPKVAVEETGPGVSKEDAEAIVTERVPPEILKLFEESKWQDKVEAYNRYAKWLIEQEYSNEIYEASFWYIKIKQKEWKEKNVNLVKAALSCLSDIIKESECMSKKASTIIIPFLAENVGDPKYNVICKENLLSLSELVGPGFAAKYIVKQASSAINPKALIENNTVIKTIIEEFGADGLPVQEIINFGIICCDNKDAKVRTETISMLSTLYKHLGEGIRTFLKGIKDSTLAVITSEFDKITPLARGEFQSKREIRNEEVKQEVEEAAGEDPLGSIARTDVSKEIANQKMINLINDNNWKKRKEAVDKMDAVLEKANNRILPNGLSEVVGLLKIKMADSNKSVAKGFLQFVGKFGEALGPAAKQYAPMLIKPMLRCLSEKNTLVRQINLEAINKWAVSIGPENIINSIGSVIEKENPEIRSVLLDWILQNKAAIPRCETDGLPKSLIECLQDKAPAIRQMAEQVIVEIMPFSGTAPFKKLMKDLKPAVQNSIKPLIDK